MAEPVFVIHGVATRDEIEFRERVKILQDRVGTQLELMPVYWGDLGARDRWLEVTIPPSSGRLHKGSNSLLRSNKDTSVDSDAEAVLRALMSEDQKGEMGISSPFRGDELDWVRQGARERIETDDDATGSSLRGPADSHDIDEFMAAVEEVWPQSYWLQLVQDAELLRQTGAALAGAVHDSAEAVTDLDGNVLRDGVDPGWLRAVVGRRMQDLDRVTGAAVQAVAGRLNQSLRTRFIPETSRFLGDVLVYQRHQVTIHERIRECIDAVDPRLGRTETYPVRVLAHSLGGVISVDMATSENPLWISSLLTFGSQSAFFHLCDPRGGLLQPYLDGQLVQLPPSIDRWTNLWEPLDVLAFIAAGVFILHDGNCPQDVAVPHLTSSGLWTHSAYWDLKALTGQLLSMIA
ncbi:hypothetical protein [Streptomyces europaeiscabiei]|uniref:hypothetical protein n=1 Tax=Streptomyces europaeiscabiei TaxID=146819 RepID=UPI0038F7A3C5